MMGGHDGGGSVFAFGIMWLVGPLAIALAGVIVAWVYNAANPARPPVTVEPTPSGGCPLTKL